MFSTKHQVRARVGAVLSATIAAPWYRWDEARRNKLAQALFAYQFAHLPVLWRAATRLGLSPDTLQSWTEVPLLPAQIHRRLPGLASASSGVELRSGGDGADCVVRVSPEGCDVAIAATVGLLENLVPDVRRRRILAMCPGPAYAPTNPSVKAIAALIDRVGRPASRFVGEPAGVDVAVVMEALRTSSDGGDPVLLIGSTEDLLAPLERMCAAGVRLVERADVVMIHTGGRRHDRDDLARLVSLARDVLNIPPERVLDVYHTTALATSFLENTCRDGALSSRVKVAPPWVRIRAVDPFTLAPLEPGRVGLLAVMDLACLDRPFHVLTDDLGFTLPETAAPETHFVVMGRGSDDERRSALRYTDHLVDAVMAS